MEDVKLRYFLVLSMNGLPSLYMNMENPSSLIFFFINVNQFYFRSLLIYMKEYKGIDMAGTIRDNS